MFFPMFADIRGAKCLVAGSGAVARRKAAVLESFGAVAVAVPDAAPCEDAIRAGEFALVVAASSDADANARLSAVCREARIPVNVVDDAEKSTFVFGAVATRGDAVAAVSTGGKSPVAAQWLRDRIRPLLTERFAAAVDRLGAMRRRGLGADFYRKELERCLGEEG